MQRIKLQPNFKNLYLLNNYIVLIHFVDVFFSSIAQATMQNQYNVVRRKLGGGDPEVIKQMFILKYYRKRHIQIKSNDAVLKINEMVSTCLHDNTMNTITYIFEHVSLESLQDSYANKNNRCKFYILVPDNSRTIDKK